MGGQTTASDDQKIVGILYSVWHDWFKTSRDQSGQPFVMSKAPPYGPYPTFNWWGEPSYGIANYLFMRDGNPETPNTELIDYHADLLVAAGVDFIAIDLTNGEQDAIVNAARAVCLRYGQRPEGSVPKIVLFVKDQSSVASLWTRFWSKGVFPDNIWFRYDGKPLLLVANAGEAEPHRSPMDFFTSRHCWGLQSTDDKWSFKQNTSYWNPGTAYWHGNMCEEMSVCAAVQATEMTNPNGRKGRAHGAYFQEQWGYVFRNQPKFVLVTAWNEWGSQNYGNEWQPKFVDCFGEEFSACLEPMQGGHGDEYYRLLRDNIQRFKGQTNGYSFSNAGASVAEKQPAAATPAAGRADPGGRVASGTSDAGHHEAQPTSGSAGTTGGSP